MSGDCAAGETGRNELLTPATRNTKNVIGLGLALNKSDIFRTFGSATTLECGDLFGVR